MKKIFLTICLLIFTANVSFASIDNATGEERKGYKGILPDLTQRFDRQRAELAKPAYDNVPTFRNKNELKPVPRNNPAYIDLIIKKQKISPYASDINEAISFVEAIIDVINKRGNIQKFVAKVNAFNDWMTYFKDRYKDKPEAHYISFQKLVAVDFQSHYLANLRYEAQLYNPYLPYSTDGAIYSPQSLENQTKELLKELEQTLIILKEVN